MNIRYEDEKWRKLLSEFYILTGIRTCIFDLNGNLICENSEPRTFCRLLQSQSEGSRRCRECHVREIARCAREGTGSIYRCYAGAYEVILPVMADGMVLAYLTFGQFLDKSALDRQWEQALQGVGWYRGDREALRLSFEELSCYSDNEIKAYGEILSALGAYIHLSGLLDDIPLTDMQRMEMYIEQHYREKLTLSDISEALKISRTRLCTSAKQSGKTVTAMIAERRVEAAKLLLSKSRDSVSAVAEAVGIPDYNYFTKIFRKITGMTPSQYRKQNVQVE